MTTLENLFYGNIRPTERSFQKGSKMDELLKLLCRNEDVLAAGLTEKQKESFEKFKVCQSEITDLMETETFTIGFTLAVKIMVEVMNSETENSL